VDAVSAFGDVEDPRDVHFGKSPYGCDWIRSWPNDRRISRLPALGPALAQSAGSVLLFEPARFRSGGVLPGALPPRECAGSICSLNLRDHEAGGLPSGLPSRNTSLPICGSDVFTKPGCTHRRRFQQLVGRLLLASRTG
jgi:hypothetical protein